jgi:hypothetical protein
VIKINYDTQCTVPGCGALVFSGCTILRVSNERGVVLRDVACRDCALKVRLRFALGYPACTGACQSLHMTQELKEIE